MVLFQGFKGVTANEIVTMVLGFLTICSGVVLLQLSKSAKDVPDAAVFSGDLDQIQTIAEQEQPETEPKADAIRGAAAIVRRISQARMRMEADELKRLHEEKMQEAMEPIGEDTQTQYEWDGLRRRRTISMSTRARSITSPPPTATSPNPYVRRGHPPLGMSRFPTDDEMEELDNDRSTIFSSIAGTISTRARARTNATAASYDEEMANEKPQSPIHPVPLMHVNVPSYRVESDEPSSSNRNIHEHVLRPHRRLPDLPDEAHQDNAHHSATQVDNQHLAPTPPPHGGARRQFSFQKVFRRSSDPTEEERVGLVKENSRKEPGPESI